MLLGEARRCGTQVAEGTLIPSLLAAWKPTRPAAKGRLANGATRSLIDISFPYKSLLSCVVEGILVALSAHLNTPISFHPVLYILPERR